MQRNTAQKDRIQQKASVFQTKPFQFRVIARPPCGRGNLKVIDVESRSEAREQKTTESPNSDPSRRDTTTALLRKRHFTRAQARISRAQHISHDQRSYFTAQPYSANGRISLRSLAALRALSSRCVRSLCMLYLPCASAKFSVFCQIFLHSLCRYDILIMCNMLLLGFVPCFMPSSRCCGEKARAMMLRQQIDQSTRWPAIIK